MKQLFSEPDVWVKGLIIGAPTFLETFVKVFENFFFVLFKHIKLVSFLEKLSVPIENFHQVNKDDSDYFNYTQRNEIEVSKKNVKLILGEKVA